MSEYSKLHNTCKLTNTKNSFLVIHYVVLSGKYNIFTHAHTHMHISARALVLCFSKVIVMMELCSFMYLSDYIC